MNYLLFPVFLFCILGLNIISSGHYVLLSKVVKWLWTQHAGKGLEKVVLGGDETGLCAELVSSPSQTPCGQSIPAGLSEPSNHWTRPRLEAGGGALFSCSVLQSLGGSA